MKKFIDKTDTQILKNDLIGNYLNNNFKNITSTTYGGLKNYEFTDSGITFLVSAFLLNITIECKFDGGNIMVRVPEEITSEKELMAKIKHIKDICSNTKKFAKDMNDSNYFIMVGN